MTYATEYDLIFDGTYDLHKKVARAIDKAARDVTNEDPGTANHVKRLHWANSIRVKPDRVLTESHRWIVRVLDNVTVSAAGNTATDNDVQFVIDGLVNSMAGV